MIRKQLKSNNSCFSSWELTKDQAKALEVIEEALLLNDDILDINANGMAKGGLSINFELESTKQFTATITKAGKVVSFWACRVPNNMEL